MPEGVVNPTLVIINIYMYKFNGENDGRIDLRILAPVPVPAWLSLHWHHRIVDVA